MRKEKINTTKLGLFVSIAIALFAFGVFKIGEKENLFGATIQVSTTFKNVNGLQPGSNVRFSGISIGSVGDIDILNDSTLKVNMVLEKKVKAFLKKNATASIGTDGLVGNMIINISPGKGIAIKVTDGDLIKSTSSIKTETVIEKLDNTTENIALLTINLLAISEKINKGSGSVATLINDDALVRDLHLAIQNLRKTSQQVNVLSNKLNDSMRQVNEGQGVLGYLLNDTTFKTKINLAIDDMDTLIKSRTAPIMNNLAQSSKDIAITTAELKNIIEQINLDNSLAGIILQDTTLANNFKEIMINLREGSTLLNEDLEALQHNFLFRRYFRKLEKRKKN